MLIEEHVGEVTLSGNTIEAEKPVVDKRGNRDAIRE